jgi:hypothetical protein
MAPLVGYEVWGGNDARTDNHTPSWVIVVGDACVFGG